MKFAIALVTAFAATAALAQNPMAALKGKLKAGQYAYKMEMDLGEMPGMPKGMNLGKQTLNFQQCVTPEDIERGQLGKGKNGNMPAECQVQDFRMSGNTASYRMVCKGDMNMTADNVITFVSDGYRMNMKMAMVRGGHTTNMKQAMEARYLGPCQK